MMRFPLRLTVDLATARLAQKSRLAVDARPVQFVDAAEILHHDSNHPVSHQKIREVISSRSPVVWIGGSEPLHHPGIAHLVRAIAGSGHFVFLETDGSLLRGRIHEFEPAPRLFLTVCLEPGTQRHSSKSLRAGALEGAAEGIRAARLSGFLMCVHACVHAESELEEMAELIQFAQSLDVDGIVITCANGGSNSAHPDAAALQQKVLEVRRLIQSKWWEAFSRLVESVVSGERHLAQNAAEAAVRGQQGSNVNEESVKVA